MTTAERTLLDRCRADPAFFFTNILGADPHPVHVEIADALATSSRVSVVGCNGSGKDWTSGRLILWWLSTRWPAKVVVLAPTHRQVHDIVWRECRTAYAQALVPMGGRMMPRDSRIEYDDETFAVGFAVDDALSIQGFHSPNLLVILSEAHGIPQAQHDAVRRLNPSAILMTGNALGAAGGEFYESHHERSDLWDTITIDDEDIADDPRPGMLTPEQVLERAAEWGEDSALYVSAIKARWPDNADDALVNLADAKAAVERVAEPDSPTILAVDVARFGGDANVIYKRQGAVARQVYRRAGESTMSLVGEVVKAIEEHKPQYVVVDAVGVGAGVVDRLRELKPAVPHHRLSGRRIGARQDALCQRNGGMLVGHGGVLPARRHRHRGRQAADCADNQPQVQYPQRPHNRAGVQRRHQEARRTLTGRGRCACDDVQRGGGQARWYNDLGRRRI